MLKYLRMGNKRIKLIWWVLVLVTVFTFVGGFIFLFGSGFDTGRQAQMTGALSRLFAVVENYPNLKADQSFLRLQDELTGTENRIAVARNDYNAAVNEYNAYIRQFPAVITAKLTGAKPRKYFTAAPGSTEAPKVDFSKPPTKAP